MLAFEIDYVEEARVLAKKHKNEFITPEHVMYVLSEQEHLDLVFKKVNINKEQLRCDLEKYFEETQLQVEVEPTCSDSLVDAIENTNEFFEVNTFALEPVFMQNLFMSGSDFIKNCIEAQNAMDKLIDFNEELIENAMNTPGIVGKVRAGDVAGVDSSVLPFLYHTDNVVDLRMKADFLYVREEYIKKIHKAVSKTDRYHVCLYGEHGVGKESLILSYAKQMRDNVGYAELDMECIVGSLQFSTNATEVFKAAVDSFVQRYEKTDKLCLLRIKNLGSAYNTAILNAFSAVLLNQYDFNFPVVTIFDVSTAVANQLRKDRLFGSLVNFIEVKEPTDDEMFAILSNNTVYLSETGHYIYYSDEAINKALEYAKKQTVEPVLNYAISLLDDAGLIHLKEVNLSGSDADKLAKLYEGGVTDTYVELAYEQLTKTSEEKIDFNKEMTMLKTLESNLKKDIFGQDKAIEAVMRQIELSKAGLLEDNKPIGSFMFVGPTGVGKTQLAKSLAEHMGVEFIKYDMSEFSEKHSISKMIGSPAGYVGYEEGGSLVKKINAHPRSVLLLDEIEKAHPNVYNILLQIMDDASLTDGRQTKANFKDVILIMTSNAGAADSTKRGVGFNNSGFNTDGMKKAVESTFAPEFRGRLSAVVEFNSLDKGIYADIIRKEIRKLNVKLKSKNIHVECGDEVVEFISNNVNTESSGARGIESYVRNNVSTLLSHGIISGTLKDHDSIRLVIKDGTINFDKVVKNNIS